MLAKHAFLSDIFVNLHKKQMLMPGSTCKIYAVSLTVKNTSSIHILAKGPQSGTIGKNHIQGSFIFCIKLLFSSALNLILS